MDRLPRCRKTSAYFNSCKGMQISRAGDWALEVLQKFVNTVTIGQMNSIGTQFRSFAQWTAHLVGSPHAFVAGVVITVIWAATGPMFHFSDTWQLVINTGTTIITFLMVFLIQSTQNRDAQAMHLKLDELIRAVGAARTHLVHLENLSDDELASLELEFQKLHEKLQGKKPTIKNSQ